MSGTDSLSMKETEANDFCKGRKATQSVEKHLYMGVANLLLMEAPIQAMKDAWLSLLASPGTVIWNKETQFEGFVLKATKVGILCWKGNAMGIGDFYRAWQMNTTEEHPWDFCYVANPDQWMVMAVRPRLQTAMAADFGLSATSAEDVPVVSFVLEASEHSSLLQHAASLGFPSLTVPQLSALWKFIGVEGKAPWTLAPLLSGLIKAVLGKEPTEAELDEMMASRGRAYKPPSMG